MAAYPIRAVYEQGHLRLLDPVDLIEGQEIQVTIVSERERAHAVLADLLVKYETSSEQDETIDEIALYAEIDAAASGKPTVSEVIIQERREGP